MKLVSTTIILAIVLAVTPFVVVSCSSDPQKQMAADKSGGAMLNPSTTGQNATPSPNSVAGIHWTVPTSWMKGPEKQMRAATYFAGSGDAQAECAVFYFGKGQGGDIDANINRWIAQVKQPDGSDSQAKAVKSEVKSTCCSVTTIEVGGTYMASGGPMMQVTAEKPGYILLGGIVPAPEGNVFFKLTGPKDTVSKIRNDFLGMLKSIAKSGV